MDFGKRLGLAKPDAFASRREDGGDGGDEMSDLPLSAFGRLWRWGSVGWHVCAWASALKVKLRLAARTLNDLVGEVSQGINTSHFAYITSRGEAET